ncbi:MAG: PilN domain-containing protein [Anaerolineae bacterium]|nr:PilN domain-containing protein [Anaerolineae bacterium]
MATSFLPLYLTSAALREEVAHLDHERKSLRATIGAASTPLPEALALQQTLTHLEASMGQLDQLRPTLESASIRWPAVVAAIGGRDPARIVLQSVTQKGREITLKGRASDAPAVARYASDLEASGLFERVAVQSLRALASPFVTPTGASGPSPTETSTPTATAGPGDEYEPDDWEPKSIYAGQPQVHSFFPASDVDNVRFLAKAGRHYRVFTTDLAPGVDTFLTVRVADQTYTNDDVAPRTLRSEVAFQVPADTDVQVIVRISNRGDYGPDMTYKVAYEEITPAPTPITPTQAPTPTATRTATPSPTLTPTPDLRDAYEPDDTVPKPIAVGQPQAHSFYPAGDIDLAAFVAGAARSYRVSTSGLSPGVDTLLEVQVGAAVYTGDDRQPGDPSSEVVFQVFGSQPVTVLITVRNRGQYGPDKMYQLLVEEISAPSAAAAPVGPTAPSGPDGEGREAPPAAIGPGYLVASAQAADGARSCSSRSHPGALAPASSEYLQTAGAVEFVIILVVRQ